LGKMLILVRRISISISLCFLHKKMEQTAEGAILAGWIELPIELRDMILFWAADGSAAMTAVLPFVCQEIKQRRSSWLPVSKPSTTSTTTRRTFLTQRDINEKIAVDASGCGWLGVLQWLREMGSPLDSKKIGFAALRGVTSMYENTHPRM